MKKLKFDVTICLGESDGGDVNVEVEVSDEEYELLKECARKEDEIGFFRGLESLYERVVRAASEKNEKSVWEMGNGMDMGYDMMSYIVEMPYEIEKLVSEE